jgi:hypothetical protein
MAILELDAARLAYQQHPPQQLGSVFIPISWWCYSWVAGVWLLSP